jgi:hypothetical protein
MSEYNMLYENVLLEAWGKTWRSEDPFKLADANTLSAVDDKLSGDRGHDAKFGLSAAIRKVMADHDNDTDLTDELLELDKTVWASMTFNDLVKALEKTNQIFSKLDLASKRGDS